MSGFSRTVIAQTEFASRLPLLKEGDAAVVVAVTHLAIADDRALGEKYPEIDLVIGGHEHYLITTTENRSLISKARSDARFVARIDSTSGLRVQSSVSTNCCRSRAHCPTNRRLRRQSRRSSRAGAPRSAKPSAPRGCRSTV